MITRLTNNDGSNYLDYDPDVSPEGRRVVFSRYNGSASRYVDLYAVKANGTGGLTRITDDPSMSEVAPAWSPDGRKIAFIAYPSNKPGEQTGETEVWVVDADGTDLKKITANRWEERGIDWSPDGSRMAFTVYGQGGPGGAGPAFCPENGVGLQRNAGL